MYTVMHKEEEDNKAKFDELMEDMKALEFRLGLFAEY